MEETPDGSYDKSSIIEKIDCEFSHILPIHVNKIYVKNILPNSGGVWD